MNPNCMLLLTERQAMREREREIERERERENFHVYVSLNWVLDEGLSDLPTLGNESVHALC